LTRARDLDLHPPARPTRGYAACSLHIIENDTWSATPIRTLSEEQDWRLIVTEMGILVLSEFFSLWSFRDP